MNRLVLIRHGQSEWNKENRFTGWTDVDLTEQGVKEAQDAGALLKKEGFQFKVAYTSLQKRAIKTLNYVLEGMDLLWIPVIKSWRLNEKHYGMLQGLNKTETAEKYGEDKVLLWRRSFDVPPTPLEESDERHPIHDPRYQGLPAEGTPATESLKDVIARITPYWEEEISKSLEDKKEVIIAAHGNSLRALVMKLKGMSEEEILKFNIPTGIPYVFEFDDELNLQKDYFIGDPEVIKALMDAVANQGKSK